MELLIKDLRKYKKKEIIQMAMNILWNYYDPPNNPTYLHLMKSYAEEIICLGLACCSVERKKQLTLNDFYNLCSKYLKVQNNSEENINFFHNIISNIKSKALKECLEKEGLHYKYFNILRNLRKQNQHKKPYFHHFFEVQAILNILRDSNDCIQKLFKECFSTSIEDFFTGYFYLYSKVYFENLNSNKNGWLVFDKDLDFDIEVQKELNLSMRKLETLATSIACKESSLELWKEEVKKQPWKPSPLYQNPLIYLDKSYNNTKNLKYLIPDPNLYFNTISNVIFSKLLKLDKNLGIGDAFEEYIYQALATIFDKEKVEKLENNQDKTADFLVKLENYYVILELKISLIGIKDSSIINPENIAKFLDKMYGAFLQCAKSALKYYDKPVIAIILTGDHAIYEHSSFFYLAKKSGLLKSTNIKYLEFLTWASLEHFLLKGSINSFLEKIINRGKNENYEPFNFDPKKDYGPPTHNYEYYEYIKNQPPFNKIAWSSFR